MNGLFHGYLNSVTRLNELSSGILDLTKSVT